MRYFINCDQMKIDFNICIARLNIGQLFIPYNYGSFMLDYEALRLMTTNNMNNKVNKS